MAEYEFCVDRKSNTEFVTAHVIFSTGDFDPGKEAVRVYVSQKFKNHDTTAITVSDYVAGTCHSTLEERMNVKGNDEDWRVLMERVAAGDPVGAAVAAAAAIVGFGAAAGATVQDTGAAAAEEARKTAENVAREAERAAQNVGDFLKKPFG